MNKVAHLGATASIHCNVIYLTKHTNFSQKYAELSQNVVISVYFCIQR